MSSPTLMPPSRSRPISEIVSPVREEEIPTAEQLPRPHRGALVLLGVFGLLVLGGALAAGLIPKMHKIHELNAAAEAEATELPPVSLQYPRQAESSSSLPLPGNLQALQETAIYARTTGYLKQWLVDIGAHVNKGQLLAVIDTPEIDAQLQQAQADLTSANANVSKSQLDLTLMETTLKRYEALIPTNGVTPQELDQHRADVAKARTALAVAQATVASDQANVKRLTDLVSFERVTAPFAGTVTARNFDVGALISANGSMGGMPIFRVAQTDVLRVFVSVPQSYATAIKPGLEAKLSVREYAGQTFSGKVVNTAGALDPSTRTLLTEVHVPNSDGKLIAGMYGQVSFEVTNPAPPLIVPVSALINNAEGSQIAVVGDDDVAHFRKIEIGRDFGTEVEVTTGITPDDKIVVNPGERLADGVKVRIVERPQSTPVPLQKPAEPAEHPNQQARTN